jgi:hypothetical protein
MERLLSDSGLRELTEKHHILDGEAPLLIKLLWDLRHFQEDLLALPIHRLELLLPQVWELDRAIALEILKLA